MPDSKLGELLVSNGSADATAVKDAVEQQQGSPQRLGELLVGDGLVNETALRDALAAQHQVEAVELTKLEIDEEHLALLPPELILATEVVPIKVERQQLHVAAVDPGNELSLDEVRAASGYADLRIHVVCASDFRQFVEKVWKTQTTLSTILSQGPVSGLSVRSAGEVETPNTTGAEPELGGAPIVSLTDHVLAEALRRQATSVLIEPFASSSRVRLRVDGALQTLVVNPRRLHDAMVHRLRALAGSEGEDGGGLDVRLDGSRSRFVLRELSTRHGASLQLRLSETTTRSLSQLGLPGPSLESLEKSLTTPTGLFLIAGPRHSGRTTTLLAIGQRVNRPSRQVILVTRQVGAGLAGALVMTVRQGKSGTSTLVQAIEHDPDVLLVDLPGDTECLKLATEAALAGQLVAATVAGDRALGFTTKLPEHTPPRWSLAAALRAVLGLRLVRRVCSECAEPTSPSSAELKELSIPARAAKQASFARAKGCAHCHCTGYRGMVLLSETAIVDAGFRQAIRDRAEPGRLLGRARESGFHTLWENAVLQLLQGTTTVEEVRAALIPH